MNLPVIEFPSTMFTVERTATGTIFSCEASDMENRHLQQFYNNARDIGFAMKSDKTGDVVMYAMNSVKRDEEGDIQYWTYHPTTESQQKVPGCRGTMVIVFND
jgi:hypothetical protein